MKAFVLLVVFLLAAGTAAAQEEELAAAETLEEKALGQAHAVLEPGGFDDEAFSETPQVSQWLWGTLDSVDSAGGTLVLKSIDYETAQEVIRSLYVDDKTVFHGVMGLADLEAGMHVTADYKDKDGRCVADIIEVESVD